MAITFIKDRNIKYLNMEIEKVKIRTMKGRILTLTISSRTLTHIQGADKFGEFVILPISEIDELLPIKSPTEENQAI